MQSIRKAHLDLIASSPQLIVRLVLGAAHHTALILALTVGRPHEEATGTLLATGTAAAARAARVGGRGAVIICVPQAGLDRAKLACMRYGREQPGG